MPEVAARVGDPDRLTAVRAALDVPAAGLEHLVAEAARKLHAPIALVTLVDAEHQYLRACAGVEPGVTGIEYSVCQYAVASGEPLVICDARIEHWLDDHPAVRDLGVRAYAGVPLFAGEHALGTLCILDFEPRYWTDEELSILKALAGLAQRALTS